ncbi:hypothetical protein BGX23_008169 [Mortierella sp. AD031]|nr:hypothetical protein BGX23_008169 [Mortierella sp. AD031]
MVGSEGIPRPDITRRVFGEPASESDLIRHGTHKEYIDLHRQVYSHLARLTKLRELVLSVPIKEFWRSDPTDDQELHRAYDCPAMSLDSGLDLLKDLKELKVVGLEDREVGINNTAEQGWVAKNWPLAEIGCTQYCNDNDEDDYEE